MLVVHLSNLLLALVRVSHSSMNALTPELSFVLFAFVLLHSILESLKNHDALVVLRHAPTEVNLLKLRPLFDLILVGATHRVLEKVLAGPHTAV